MTTKAIERKTKDARPSGLARDAYHHILCRPHTSETLAQALGVSMATVARLLAGLRRSLAEEGASLVSVKEGGSWRYEVRDEREGVWESDPFVRAVGFASGVRRRRGQSIDEALYGRLRRTR